MPFKCPAAPYEAAFLLDEYFGKRGVREKTEIGVFTPERLPMPAAGPENGKAIKSMLESRNISFNPEVQLTSINSKKRELRFKENKNAPFDLLIFIPPHQAPKVIRNLSNGKGWMTVNRNTLKTKYDKVFAIGGRASVTLDSGKPLSKAGVFAHFEAEVVAENIAAEIKSMEPDKKYDGHAYCFLEVGYGKAGFAGGNFYATPAHVIKMRKPGRVWYWGKILFEKYWFWKWF